MNTGAPHIDSIWKDYFEYAQAAESKGKFVVPFYMINHWYIRRYQWKYTPPAQDN